MSPYCAFMSVKANHVLTVGLLKRFPTHGRRFGPGGRGRRLRRRPKMKAAAKIEKINETRYVCMLTLNGAGEVDL